MGYRSLKDKDEIVSYYIDRLKRGDVSLYFRDKYRYHREDKWLSYGEWISIAKEMLSFNELDALEILLQSNERDNYIERADKVLSSWYAHGAYDIEYYQDILILMPKEYHIRKSIIGDYFNFDDIDEFDVEKDMLVSLLRYSDDDKLKMMYGSYIDKKVLTYKDDYDILEEFVENSAILEYAPYLDKNYISKETLMRIKDMLLIYLQKDKDMFYKIRAGYIPDEEERTLWVVDYIATISYFLKYYDILEYLKSEDWYWEVLFDEGLMNDIYNNNLLVWSYYMSSDILKKQAMSKLSNRYFDDSIDAIIALSRMKGFD